MPPEPVPGGAPAVDLTDVQTIVAGGFGSLAHASFLLFQLNDAARMKEWLTSIVRQVSFGEDRSNTRAINVAFTHEGLRKIGLEERALNGFAQAFRDGMVVGQNGDQRSRLVGDRDESAPTHWDWGNAAKPVHVVLFLYAADVATLDALEARQKERALAAGLTLVPTVRAAEVKRPLREPFGFVDGLSQPPIAGIDRASGTEAPIATGEFLLGYRNEDGAFAPSPMVTTDEAANKSWLAPALARSRRDFGRNGTYVVIRQLEQDVLGFWQFVRAQAEAKPSGSLDKWAAKMMGRWRSGTPLVLAPDSDNVPNPDDPERKISNDFAYRRVEDDDGLRCPIGSHIRRANPRDALPGTDAYRSLAIVRQHRIVRRGRAYGTPLDGWPDPNDMLGRNDGSRDRGLYFICVNADIERQFEFIQQRWLEDPSFVSTKSGEIDPVVGNPDPGATFTVPAKPVSLSLGGNGTPMRRFVTPRGGAYFFLPSRSALTYLGLIARA